MKSIAPKVAILSIGDEILDGRISEKNASFFIQKLSAFDFSIQKVLFLPDSLVVLIEEIQNLVFSKKYDYLFISGGIGPTSDDRTREALGKALNIPFYFRQEIFDEKMQEYKNYFQKDFEKEKKQFFFPKNTKTFQNKYGIAPAFSFYFSFSQNKDIPYSLLEKNKDEGVCFFIFPGVVKELKFIYQHHLKSYLKRYLSLKQDRSFTFKIYGIAESLVEKKVQSLLEENKISWSLLPKETGSYFLKISFLDSLSLEKEKEVIKEIQKILTPHIYAVQKQNLISELYQILLKRGKSLSFVESCTGGLLSSSFSKQKGVSKVYKGAAVLYQKEVKILVSQINPALIEKTMVNKETVSHLAEWASSFFQSDICVATSGVTGPSKASIYDPPLGTVYFAFYLKKENILKIENRLFKGSRSMIQKKASFFAFYTILNLIKNEKTDT